MKHRLSKATRLRRWREGESSPATGNLSARPAGKPGSLFAKERLRRSLLRHCPVATAKHPEPSGCVFKAWRNLSGPMWFQSQNQTPGRDRAASRTTGEDHQTTYPGIRSLVRLRFTVTAPSPGKRTHREDRVPSHRPQMSSGRLFLDRVARQQCPSPLHRHPDPKTWTNLKKGFIIERYRCSFPCVSLQGFTPLSGVHLRPFGFSVILLVLWKSSCRQRDDAF
jgi:hypothetical protein